MATHSEYCSVPRNLFAPVPPGVQAIEAAFATLGINAMHGVRQGKIGLGDTVVIVGTGLIGQLAAQLARLCGGRVIVVGYRNAQRLALAAQLGAELAILSSQQDPVQAVLDHTEGFGADVVIMCAASAETSILSQCLGMVRKNGRVVVVGLAPLEIPFYLWHRKEAELLISRAYGPGRHEPEYEEQGLDYPAHFVRWTLNRNMQEFLRLLAEKKLNVRALISHEYRLDEISSVFDDLLERAGESLGIVLRYGE
jgi:threonine dehydrogenase-like Zn-dependent dehydrogenase